MAQVVYPEDKALEIDLDYTEQIDGKTYKVNFSTTAYQVKCLDGESVQDKINKRNLAYDHVVEQVQQAMKTAEEMKQYVEGLPALISEIKLLHAEILSEVNAKISEFRSLHDEVTTYIEKLRAEGLKVDLSSLQMSPPKE